MKKKIEKFFGSAKSRAMVLYFLPLIVAGGRLALRMVLNIWDFIER